LRRFCFSSARLAFRTRRLGGRRLGGSGGRVVPAAGWFRRPGGSGGRSGSPVPPGAGIPGSAPGGRSWRWARG